LTNGEEDD